LLLPSFCYLTAKNIAYCSNSYFSVIWEIPQERLAYVALGECITSGKQLARLAHTREDTALEFLRAERSKSHATC
jgi:hypothetical protein